MNLEDHGWEVLEAADGRSALAIVQIEQPFDVVLLDWQMPGMDGMAVRAELLTCAPDLPVLFLTSARDRLLRDLQGPVPCERILDKTIGFAALQRCLLQAMVAPAVPAPGSRLPGPAGLRALLRKANTAIAAGEPAGMIGVLRLAPLAAGQDPAALLQQIARRLEALVDTAGPVTLVGATGLVFHQPATSTHPMTEARALRDAVSGTVMIGGRRVAPAVGIGLAPIERPGRVHAACARAARLAARRALDGGRRPPNFRMAHLTD